ncbi:MAG TPA: hypothetical protein VGD30_18605 [Telluria sp.]
MSHKFSLRLFLMAAYGLAAAQIGDAVAQSALSVSCKSLAQEALANENQASSSLKVWGRELCFPSYEGCVERGGLPAESIWRNARHAEEAKSILLEYEDVIGAVSEVNMPAEHGKLVRIARMVGTAYCVRDTYFLYRDNTYRLVDSPSLNGLSDEATHCGDAEVELKEMGEPILVTRLGGVVTAYRFVKNFELSKICSVRYRAPRP